MITIDRIAGAFPRSWIEQISRQAPAKSNGDNTMNKFMKKAGIASVLVVALALVVIVTGAFAQGPATPDLANGSGQMRQGNRAGVAGTGLGARAVDEADMHAAIAEALSMTLEDFEAAVAEGQTPYTLAAERGIDFAVIQAAMATLHAEALEEATAEGLIPQGAGNMAKGAGNMARGAGNMSQSTSNQGGYGGDCLYETP